jgi:UDP-glucose 6-dehydrogenase
MTKILIVGFGEVGQPLYEIVRGVYPDADWLDVDERQVMSDPEIMHITYSEMTPESFVETSARYVKRFDPSLVLIETTVTPGTTMMLYRRLDRKPLLCHSPVRGNISEGMKKGVLQYTKFIGGVNEDSSKAAKNYYESLGLKTHLCSSPVETELGKIFETTYRGIMMAWFQDISRMCKHFDANYDQVVEFVGSTEREGKQARPVFHPGVIGGHCIIPNAEKLLGVYRSKFVEALLESNKKRQQEIEAMEQHSSRL